MKLDGGVLYLTCKYGDKFLVLITEVKNQGTNDLRLLKGKKHQAKENAIERLGKNMIGFRTFLLNESIFPFICFGYGCDFEDGSSILDRVVTIAMFGSVNKIYLHNTSLFNRGSFFFRPNAWRPEEMFNIMYQIAKGSIFYYFSKYGDNRFL